MEIKKNKKLIKKNRMNLVHPKRKGVIVGLAIGIALVVIGGVGALNGWFGGGASIPEDTFTRGLVGYWSMDEGDGSLAKDSSPYANHGMINDGGSGNPVSYWTFDEQTGTTAYDSIGSNNGTLTNGPTWNSGGQVGGAMEFDGTNDYVDCGTGLASQTYPLTFEAWVRPNTLVQDGIIVNFDVTSASSDFAFGIYNTGDEILAGVSTARTGLSGISTYLTAGKWQHWAIVFTDTTHITLYLDGVAYSSTVTDYYSVDSSKTIIGSRSNKFFNGIIDDVRVYNYARAAAQIQRDYVESYKSKWVPGKVAGAMEFDGIDDFVDVGTTSFIDDTVGSLSAWIKIDDNSVVNGIISKGGDSDSALLWIRIDGDAKINILDTTSRAVKSTNALNEDQWYFITVTTDGSTYKIYLDGNEETLIVDGSNTGNWFGDVSVANSKITLGDNYRLSGHANFFNGSIDEVRIYNRALTAAEVKFHYSRGAPVGYWKFDEGSGTLVGDSTDNVNNAIIHGPSLSFDGTDDYVDCGVLGAITFPSGWSHEVWVRPSLSGGADQYISLKGTTNINGWEFWLSNGKFRVILWNASAGVGTGPQGSDLRDDEWHHLIATYDNANILLYVDGVLIYTKPDIVGLGTTITAPVYLGQTGVNTGFYKGTIDEPRIYNRALTATEVKEHYRGLFKDESGLVMYLPFDENTGDTAYDHSTNSNNGDLAGACPGAATCPTWTSREGPSWTTGRFGNALSFDGSDDYLDAGNDSEFDMTSSFTVSAWIKTSVKDDYRYVIDKWDTKGFKLFILKDTGQVRFEIGDGSLTPDVDSIADISDGEWHHAVGVRDVAADTMNLYFDGLLNESTTDTTTSSISNSVSVLVGENHETTFPRADRAWNGSIDDVRIYNYARTLDEIRLDYNAGFSARFGPHSSCDEDPGACMTNGLVGYWNMDEGVGQKSEDASGEGNNGTLGSSSSSDTNDPKWATGKKRGALEFDGANDYVYVEYNNSLNVHTSGLTYEAFFYVSSLPTVKKTIFSQQNSYDYNRISLLSTGKLEGEIDYATNQRGLIQSLANITTNVWHHAAITYNLSTMTFFLDGVSQGSLSFSGMYNITGLTRMGTYANGAGEFFNGTIDEVKIYNRALSATEVRFHYNQGGPVAHWTFDEGNGTTAYDESDNSNDGTLKSSGLDFDGTNDYVDVGSDSSLKFTAASYTIEAWIKVDAISSTYFGIFGNFGPGSCGGDNYGGYNFNVYSDNRLQFRIGKADGTTAQWYSTNTITRNEWAHVAVNVGGDSDFYINGNYAGTHSGAVALCAGNNSMRIGMDNNNPGYADGTIDEVRIYNTALSAAEVARHYNNDFSQDPTANLVMLHHFEEGMACNANDEAGCLDDDDAEGVNDGTLKNFDAITTWDNGTDGWVSEVKKSEWRWDTGKYGQAGSFNGWDDIAEISDNNSLDFGTGNFSVESWIKTESYSGHIVSKQEGSGDYDGFYVYINDNGKIQVHVNVDGASSATAISTSTVTDNIWHHIAWSGDKTSTSTNRIFLDGIEVDYDSRQQMPSGTINNSIALTIGGSVASGGTFSGSIDDVRIYNYARSVEEIRVDYNAGLAGRFGPLSGCDEDPGSCMDKGLVGSWNFDEVSGTTATDASGYGNNGTLTNNPTWTTGKIKGALQFDGVNDYVQLNQPSQMTGMSSFSVELWAKVETDKDYGMFIDRGTSGDVVQFHLYNQVGGPANQISFRVKNINGDGATASRSGKLMASEGWTHLMGTYNGTTVILYVNGVAASTTAPLTGIVATPALNLAIGARSGGGYGFNGIIDEVKIYNRALSATEIRYHYNKGGPVAYWDFDEGEGQTAYDYTDNDNDGTLGATSGSEASDPTWVEGKYGSALSFDGTDDYVEATDLDATSAITVGAWIKPSSITGNDKRIIDKRYDTGYVLGIQTGGNLNLCVGISGGYQCKYSSGGITVNEWQYVVGTWDGSTGILKMFRNGQEISSYAGLTGSITGNAVNVLFGIYHDKAQLQFSGIIDEVRIYNYARTQEQILQDYNQGAVRFK